MGSPKRKGGINSGNNNIMTNYNNLPQEEKDRIDEDLSNAEIVDITTVVAQIHSGEACAECWNEATACKCKEYE